MCMPASCTMHSRSLSSYAYNSIVQQAQAGLTRTTTVNGLTGKTNVTGACTSFSTFLSCKVRHCLDQSLHQSL